VIKDRDVGRVMVGSRLGGRSEDVVASGKDDGCHWMNSMSRSEEGEGEQQVVRVITRYSGPSMKRDDQVVVDRDIQLPLSWWSPPQASCQEQDRRSINEIEKR
jgi:hypothetical protein